MRIVVASPPKMGNKWLKCLLGTLYGLKWLKGDDTPPSNPLQFKAWVDAGNFPDGTIFHQHCRYTPRMAGAIEAIPSHLVTIVRDPYDAFVSMYSWLQTRAVADTERGKQRRLARPRDAMIGKPLDDPAVLSFLAEAYGEQIDHARDWVRSGRAVVVRYEGLAADAVGEVSGATDQLRPMPAAAIAAAVETCRADNMRQVSPKMAMHVRSGVVGDSRDRLSEPHLAIFRDQYAAAIRALGYEVR